MFFNILIQLHTVAPMLLSFNLINGARGQYTYYPQNYDLLFSTNKLIFVNLVFYDLSKIVIFVLTTLLFLL